MLNIFAFHFDFISFILYFISSSHLNLKIFVSFKYLQIIVREHSYLITILAWETFEYYQCIFNELLNKFQGKNLKFFKLPNQNLLTKFESVLTHFTNNIKLWCLFDFIIHNNAN